MYFVIGVLLLLVVSLAAASYYFYYLPRKEAAAIQALQAAEKEQERLNSSVGEASPAEQIEEILAFHLQMTGLSQVKSYRLDGKYSTGALRMGLRMQAKQPNFYRLRLQGLDSWITFGFNGKSSWIDQSQAIIDEANSGLKTLNETMMHLECTIPILSWLYESKLHLKALKRLPDAAWGGRRFYVLEDSMSFRFPVVHYIDAESGREVRRTIDFELNNEPRNVEIRYYDPIENLTFSFPSGFELSLDGKTLSSATFSKVDFNKGLLSILFEKESARQTN